MFGAHMLQVGSQYVCWNSFKSCWYLGKRDHSEIFSAISPFDTVSQQVRRNAAYDRFPSGKVVFVDIEKM